MRRKRKKNKKKKLKKMKKMRKRKKKKRGKKRRKKARVSVLERKRKKHLQLKGEKYHIPWYLLGRTKNTYEKLIEDKKLLKFFEELKIRF